MIGQFTYNRYFVCVTTKKCLQKFSKNLNFVIDNLIESFFYKKIIKTKKLNF